MSLAELQELERASVIGSYARLPVEFVRGEGARLWDVEGNEYLDFLCGISVTSLGHCHPRVVEAVREQVGRLMHVEQPVLHRARDAPRRAAVAVEPRRQGVLLQLGRRGQRGGDQARAQGAPRRRRRGRPRRLPRTYLRRAVGDPAGVQAGAVRAARAGLSRGRTRRPRRCARRSTSDTAAVLLEPIQGESGVQRALRTSCWRARARRATSTARR